MMPRRRPLVLMYHGVGDRSPKSDPYHLFVAQDRIRRQLTTLLDHGWTPLPLDAYLSGDTPPRSVLLTFDDGYRGMVDEGLPLLRELGVPATVFVLTGLIGDRSRWMPKMPAEPLVSAEDIQEMVRSGLDVECHGWDHSSLVAADEETLQRNVTEAARVLGGLTGRRPRAFAYPYGEHDEKARQVVAKAGFAVAFSTHTAAGPYAVPRVDVNSTDTDATFWLKTLRGYRVLRRGTGLVPGLRPALHSLLGRAPQS